MPLIELKKMLVSIDQTRVEPPRIVTLRCPKCHQLGNFPGLNDVNDIRRLSHAGNDFQTVYLGQRICPDDNCSAHVFVVLNEKYQVIRSYPPQRIDFDSNSIPAAIVKTFEEALSCCAEELYVASAIMIRRTLEEICQDKQATGRNLKDRLIALKGSIVLPQGLIEAFDDLRLLGNDAAHIEAQTYEEVGREELIIAIEITKEILKAIYQMDDLLSRLRALKRQPT